MLSQTEKALPLGLELKLVYLSQYHGEGNRPIRTHRHAQQVTASAVFEAIRAGKSFSVRDVRIALKLPGIRCHGEFYYSAAVEARNMGFLKGMEHIIKRRPFFYRGVRLHLFQDITWDHEAARVTSLNDEKGYVVLCTYHAGTQKVRHRHKLTRADLRAASRAPS